MDEQIDVDDSVKLKWEEEQNELRKKLIECDVEVQQSDQLKLIGGVDISYLKNDQNKAFVCLVVLDLSNNFETVYSNCSFVTIKNPYIAGFLAFREVEFLIKELNILKSRASQFLPQVWLVDGNGMLHPRRFGLASHFGVVTDTTTVGVAKNPYYLDYPTIECKNELKLKIKTLQEVGDWIPIEDTTGKVVGAALKSTKISQNPIYVSVGHRISLETAIKVVMKCCKYRLPEPIRRADFLSRENIRRNV